MTAVETNSLLPIVAWLEQLSRLGLPRWLDADFNARAPTGRVWLRDLRAWCAELGLEYPACLIQPPDPCEGLRAVVHNCGLKPERRMERHTATHWEYTAEGRYWFKDPATTVYRSLSRYLRRHVARRTELLAMEFIEKADPIWIAKVLRTGRRPMAAFAEMVWAHSMEINVVRRRWPSRPVEPGYIGRVDSACMPPDFKIDQCRATWIAYHAGAQIALARWHAAQQVAIEAVLSGVANWKIDATSDEMSWTASWRGDQLRLVELRSPVCTDWSLPLPNKDRRRSEATAENKRRLECRLALVRSECEGPCLTWSADNEWRVLASFVPQCDRVDLHRLLGLPCEKPRFWLFQSEDRFVARLCETRLQVACPTPRESIDRLRCALRKYRCFYPGQRSQRPIRLESMPESGDRERSRYIMSIHAIAHLYGFWRGATDCREHAELFLQQQEDRRQKSIAEDDATVIEMH